MNKLFRILIVVSNIAFIMWFFQPYNTAGLYSDEIKQLLGADGYGGIDQLLKYSVQTGWGLLVLYVITAIGLFFYLKPARTIFSVLLVLSIFLPLFYGVSVQSNIDATLRVIINMGDAVVWYMAYFSSVSSQFSAHNQAIEQTA